MNWMLIFRCVYTYICIIHIYYTYTYIYVYICKNFIHMIIDYRKETEVSEHILVLFTYEL